MKKNQLTLLPLIILSTVVQADTIDTESFSKGLWLGVANGVIIRENTHQLSNESHYGLSGKLELGYRFHPNASLYSAYDYADLINNNKLHITTLGIQAYYDLTDNLAVYSSLGLSGYFSDSKHDYYKSDSLGGSVGFGLEYQISDRISAKLGYNYFHNISLKTNDDIYLQQVYLGLAYKFYGNTPTLTANPILHNEADEKELEIITVVEKDVIIPNEFIIPFMIGKYRIEKGTIADFYIDEIAKILTEHPDLSVKLTGRADKTGSVFINERISRQRAESVASYLVNRGISEERIKYTSVSTYQPLYNGFSNIERSVFIEFVKKK